MANKPRAIIVGGHEQACNVLEYLIQNNIVEMALCIARKDDTGDDGVFPSLLKKSRSYDVLSLQPDNLNSSRILNSVSQVNADIVLSLQNNMIFGEEWVGLFEGKLGIVNVHYAPLPMYAGYWPEMWAIWNGEKRFAVSMHYVTNGIDTGPIVAQRWFDLACDENRESLYNKSTSECFKMLKDHLPNVMKGKVAAIEQEKTERTYYPKSLPNDGFLDLQWDKNTQNRFIRAIAFPGFPGPKIKIGTEVYTIIAEDLKFFKKVSICS